MKKIIVVTLFILFSFPITAQHEVIYHVFQRSFFDSNGDSHWDLKGMQQKLDYLPELW